MFRPFRMGTNSVKSHLENKADGSFRTRHSTQRHYTKEGSQGRQGIKSGRPKRPQSRKGDDSVSVQKLGIRMSMRTDRQSKILSLGPVTVTGTLAKKWLTSFQHEQLFIPKHGFSRAYRRK